MSAETEELPRDSIEVREPAGLRQLTLPLRVGGIGAQIVVPGADGTALQIDRQSFGFVATRGDGEAIYLNGERLVAPRELRDGDALRVGAAHLNVGLQGSQLRLDVLHLEGNDTVAPINASLGRDTESESEDAVIRAAVFDAEGSLRDGTAGAATTRGRAAAAGKPLWPVFLGVAILAGALLTLVTRLQRLPLDVLPQEARVVAADAWLSWRSGDALLVLPGKHRVRATAPGFTPFEAAVGIGTTAPAPLRIRLAKLPGKLLVDSGGVRAVVSADGAPIGNVPGLIELPPGAQTLTFKADHHLDEVVKVQIEGASKQQSLRVNLRSSWGAIALTTTTPGAQLSVDGAAAVALPTDGTARKIDMPEGLHRLAITASGAKPWENTLLVKAGNVVSIGPITLGAPDARLTIRSAPAAADVSLAGVFRGKTPLTISVPPGATQDLLVAKAGYESWSRSVAPHAGESLSFAPRLVPRQVALTISGEPADADIVINGEARGRTPQTLQLLATVQHVEIRKAGLQTFANDVDLAPGLARTLEYRLVPAGRPVDWKPASERLTSKLGVSLRLIPLGSFRMGSERREQGRRPNEWSRQVTFTRPFYLATREVTNGEYRRFKPSHSAGFVDEHTVDLDGQSASGMYWADAVEYCNWLSQQEGLPAAYEKSGNNWALKLPATSGYRLPTEAEWEYAARRSASGMRRYEWGDELPVPVQFANLAGAESARAAEVALEGYRDEYQSIAPPGKFPANSLGLYDMTGNVSEWVNDSYTSFADNAPVSDPIGSAAGARHVIRGANWRTATIAMLRLAWREGTDTANQEIGFRVARYAE